MMPKFRHENNAKQCIIYDPAHFPQGSSDFFDPEYWQRANCITGQAKGRGTTYFFHYQEQDYVLRHYRRGGLIGKILKDRYLFSTVQHTRPWQELHLLTHMKSIGLPCPTPVGAKIQRHLLSYRADLITLRIPQAQDLHHHLQSSPLTKEIWQKIGRTIKRFHHAQIYHHDLNVRNIMLDDQDNIWLIDFDKCAIRKGEQWKNENLSRLRRSFDKEKARTSDEFYFDQTQWTYLLAGYQEETGKEVTHQ
jgi:3-deoxy-D-manno-octulosonic acid kinase